MSRIDELIREMCPDGVEFLPLSELCDIQNGFAFSSELFNTEGRGTPLIRIRDINTGFSGTFFSSVFDSKFLVDHGDIVIGMDGAFQAIRWPHERALLNQRTCRLQNFRSEMNPQFLFHALNPVLHKINGATEQSTVKHLSTKQLGQTFFPVPPMAVQEEIVRILDTFTELEAELEAELALRSKQLQEMRDRVYSIARVGAHVQQTLSEVGSFARGTGLIKSDLRNTGAPAIHYGQIHTKLDVWADDTDLFVDEPLFGKLRKAEPGDAIVVTTSEDDEAVGKTIAWMGKEPVSVSGETYIFRHELDPFYLAHFFYSSSFHKQKSRYLTGTKVRRISGKDLEKILIPVCPLPEQRKIGLALNSLRALSKDIGHGIPAEIAARRKQYEYYRDKLLTFEELVA